MTLQEHTAVGRDISRANFDGHQILFALQRPVVRHLMALAKFRNRHPGFGGEFHFDSWDGFSAVL